MDRQLPASSINLLCGKSFRGWLGSGCNWDRRTVAWRREWAAFVMWMLPPLLSKPNQDKVAHGRRVIGPPDGGSHSVTRPNWLGRLDHSGLSAADNRLPRSMITV